MRGRDGGFPTLLRAGAFELVHRAEDRLNRRLLSASEADAVEPPTWARSAGHAKEPEKLDTAFVLTTYRRPTACARLVAQLGDAIAEAPSVGRHAVLVLDDASPDDYGASLVAAHERLGVNLEVQRATRNHGKRDFWRVVQRAFDWVASRQPDVAIFLQDDLELAPGAVRDALAIWGAIRDPDKAVLNLLVTDDDEPNGRWVHLRRERREDSPHTVTGWFDLAAFLAGPRFWETTRTEVFPVHPSRWLAWPNMSTRVARQLTLRLWGRATIHQVARTLVFHGAEASQMNLEARRERPMDNRPR